MHLAKMQMQRPSAFSITRTPPTGKTPNKKKMQCKQCVRYIFRLVKHCSCSHVGQGGMSHCFNFLVDGGAAHEFEPCWTLGSLACHKLKISPWHATVIAFSTAQEGKKNIERHYNGSKELWPSHFPNKNVQFLTDKPGFVFAQFAKS